MSDLVRCKACGFITRQEKVRDVCPACGVPARMFEPYTHPVSIKRRRILDLHTHPVLVHFPQAFGLTLFGLSLFAFFIPPVLHQAVTSTIKVLSALLPISVLPAIATGLLDGKLRFRKVTTPALKKKILLSLIFFFTAVILAGIALFGQMSTFPVHFIYFLATIIVSLCGAFLGLIGGKLLDAKFPG